MTITGTPAREALDSAMVALTASGVETPRLDAELLLAHALGVDRSRLVLDPQMPVAGEAARRFRDDVRSRAVERVPVAYLIGRRGFRHLELDVDRRVLIPRPETEHLVEAALELAPGAAVHEVGTGSGAVALAVKHERPDLVVSASDSSPAALHVARENARRLGLDVTFQQADLLTGIRQGDAVLANLPYVRDDEPLAADVERHEPASALRGGPDGLDVIRRLVAQLSVPWVALEVGAGQHAAVQDMLSGWTTRVDPDLAGIGRIVVAWRT